MHNRDEMIRQASLAAQNHATGVHRALGAYLQGGCAPLEQDALRAELVALAAGFEDCAHDGSTYAVRQEAARAALAAWDGPQLEQATYEPMQIRAARVVWTSVYGVVTFTDGGVGHLPHGFEALLALGVEATGGRGEAAVLWAMAEQQRRREAEGSTRTGVALAQALDHIATELGSETAQGLVERMPERLKDYVRTVWLKGRPG